MTAKEKLRELVDELSEAEAAAELKLWFARRRGLVALMDSAPVDDEPFTGEDEAALAESYDALGRPTMAERYRVVDAEEAEDACAGTDVPGEFRSLTAAVGAEQLAATLIRVLPHADFEQGTGHFHDEIEELYIVTRGTLTMRFDDEVVEVGAGSLVRVAPGTTRSHRNCGDEPVEMWAVSRRSDDRDATKVEDFWEASPAARQTR